MSSQTEFLPALARSIDPATVTPNPAIRKKPLDVKVLAALAQMTGSISPMSLALAVFDWAGHLALAPGKRMDLLSQAYALNQEVWRTASSRSEATEEDEEEKPDRRFADPAWQSGPFKLFCQAFLATEAWWQSATTGIPGVSRHHEHLTSFMARQLLDIFSPGNYLFSNPVVLRRTMETGGGNLAQGWRNFMEDMERRINGRPPVGTENFQVGKNVAVTPGKVVFRNRLVELIQYVPTTDKVYPEPVLIVPAWIMKYYILDLSPHNSLIKYMVDQGYTVFCLSWKNPGEEEANLGMDDYLSMGIDEVLDAIAAIVPDQKVHAAGYCLGGTLLSIANAAMHRDGQDRLASMTLFTAQTDFTEPGELALFIDDSELAMLEAQMRDTGYLTAGQMAGAFQLLNSYDLLWSKMINEYLLGERSSMNDLMAWNADATRMPALMHAQYLRRLFLNDDLSEGRYPVRGKPVALTDIRTPIYCVATLTDHVAPWRSVYKIHYLTPAEITFVLTKGGHNAGIVSEPGRRNRYYQILERPAGGVYVSPDDWQQQAPRHEGSWWPAWSAWLQARSGTLVKPPALGAPQKGYPVLMDAPGSYVLEK
ncbi:MAG: alpha/beta fold hydrolase [Azovibrio sp.]|uniref:PHA/PHB synthase family protein n=1 Tax=Azovibrio sp. TaxID=1872673 RepID=UPI003C78E089